MLCQDLISQVGAQGVGPLPCLIAGLFCDPGLQSPLGATPAWLRARILDGGSGVEKSNFNSCLQQEPLNIRAIK